MGTGGRRANCATSKKEEVGLDRPRHTLRKPASNTTWNALSWNPQGKRKRGRPRNSWRRDFECEVKGIGLSWTELGRTAQNLVRWRKLIDGLCSAGGEGPKYVYMDVGHAASKLETFV